MVMVNPLITLVTSKLYFFSGRSLAFLEVIKIVSASFAQSRTNNFFGELVNNYLHFESMAESFPTIVGFLFVFLGVSIFVSATSITMTSIPAWSC